MDDRLSFQLVDGDGKFNSSGLETFARSIKLAECGVSYAVVSIMGPQSSGKSTLLNHLFRTSFREMDALTGRSQTTNGIWMAKCVGIEPCTIVMDLEGTDGRERGEDDTAFERQSALFALAVSDIVLINIWCNEIGREQAANKPLLKTVFQVMMQLFNPRKTTLLFVIRDKSRTPLEILERILREDIQKIWDAVPKPQAHKETPLSDIFIVGVIALSSYEEKEEQFKQQVTSLREGFSNSIIPGALAGDRSGVVPASGFCYSLEQIWSVIKENKDLDLPTHKIMVATVRCEEISNVKFASFCKNESWLELEETAQANYVLGFGKKLSAILDSCLSGYDLEAIYFEDTVKTEKRQQLESKILQLIHSAYLSVLGHLQSRMLDNFKVALDEAWNSGKGFAVACRDCSQKFVSDFDEGCQGAAVARAKWDPSENRDKLKRDIDAHITAVRSLKLAELNAHYEEKLKRALEEPVQASLEEVNTDTWSTIRKLLQDETKRATDGLSSAISDFDIDQPTKDQMLSEIEEYARNAVVCKAKEKVTMGNVLLLMKDRFRTLFDRDWTNQQDISTFTKSARLASLKLLSVMAAIRLDDSTDNIENILSLALADTANNSVSSLDLLASSSWEEVSSSMTLLTPVQCKSLWRQFKVETEYIVTQAAAAQATAAQAAADQAAPAQAATAAQVAGAAQGDNSLGQASTIIGMICDGIQTVAILGKGIRGFNSWRRWRRWS